MTLHNSVQVNVKFVFDFFFIYFIFYICLKRVRLNLSTNLPMFVYTFQAMWRHRPLEGYLFFVGIRDEHSSFSPFALGLPTIRAASAYPQVQCNQCLPPSTIQPVLTPLCSTASAYPQVQCIGARTAGARLQWRLSVRGPHEYHQVGVRRPASSPPPTLTSPPRPDKQRSVLFTCVYVGIQVATRYNKSVEFNNGYL